MISPYVRRLRLATELRTLRTTAGLTHDQLAKQVGLSRPQVSRLENGHSADQADILAILEALNVDGDRWTQIVTIAREAAEQGWWESTKGIGQRQAQYADLEAGATSIREYQQTFPPGLLQIREYSRARNDAEAALRAREASPDGVWTGRAGRQRMLRRPGGPTLEVIVDEIAIRRLTAPPEVIKQQLYHLASSVNGDSKMTLRVLPIGARVEGFLVPRCTFSLYTYPDPGDPSVVAIDTVTSDMMFTESAEVAPYEQQFTRLRDASLSPADSLDLLTEAAGALAADDEDNHHE